MKKNKLVFFIVPLIILVLLTGWLGVNIYEKGSLSRYDMRWYGCIEYIENGELYGGHLECEQGPVIFYYGYFLKQIFGAPQEAPFHQSIFITMILIMILAFFLIIKTLRHYGYKDILLPWFIFIIIASMDPKIDHWMAMILFFSGFYTLYIWKNKYKEYVAAILFSLGIATKVTLLSPLAFLFLHYIFKEKIVEYRNNSFVLSKRKLLKFIKIPVIITVITLAIIIYYPNVIYHAFLVHINPPTEITLLELLKRALFTFQVKNYLIYGIILITSIFFLKTKRIYYLIVGLPLFILTFNLLRNGLMISFYLQANLYLYLILIFFPIAFTAMKYDLKKYFPKRQYVFYAIIIILFIWPSYVPNPVAEAIDNTLITSIKEIEETKEFLKNSIQSVLSAVPEQKGKILFEYGEGIDKHLEARSASFKENEITNPDDSYFGQREFYDPWIAIPMIKMLGEQHEEWLRTHPPKNLRESGMAKLTDEFRNLSYSLIVEGPPQWSITLALVRENQDILRENYCAVIVPDYTYVEPAGRHHRTLYFLNNSHCLIMLNNTVQYYSTVFDSICQIDQYVANNIVLGVLQMNGLNFNTACNSGADWLSQRGTDPAPDAKEKMKINFKKELIYLISIIVLLVVGLSVRRKD